MSDSFNSAFKLHSHAPNFTSAPHKIPTVSSITTSSQPYCICAHCTHLFTFNHHPGRSRGSQSQYSQSQQSSRWSPTPAQLVFLEEIYRRGTKTPTAEQIHQIASQLRRFGTIEAKNVFYWFQNHKARERQKRRRSETEITITPSSSGEQKQPYVMGIKSEKQLQQEAHQGTGNEVKDTKKWASPSNCSRHAEVSASLDIAERQAHYWTKFEERELQVLTTTCQNKMPCFPSSPLKNMTSHTHTQTNSNPLNYDDEETADSRTLDLFPQKRDEQEHRVCITESEDDFCANSISMDSEITSSQYFEFLPMRH